MSAQLSGSIRPSTGGGAGGESLTNSQIKTKYEANANTNAFTDTEKTKLGNLDLSNIKTVEELQDLVAAMVQSGTHTNASISYDDAAGTISITATASGGSSLTDEEVQDIVGGLTTQGTGINVNYDDANDTLILSLSGESFTTALKNKLDAIDMSTKQDTLVSGTNIKTVNGTSVLGSGDIVISGGSGGSTSGSEKLLRIPFGKIANHTTAFCKKGNDLFYSNGGNGIHRLSRFSQGGDFIPNNGVTTAANTPFHAPVISTQTIVSIFSLDDNDDYIYFVQHTGLVTRLNIVTMVEEALSITDTISTFFTTNFAVMPTGVAGEVLAISASNMKKYDISGLTMTSKGTNIKTPIVNSNFLTSTSFSQETPCIAGGHLYAKFNGESNNSGILAKINISDNSYTLFKDYYNRSQRSWGLGYRSGMFECDGYVYHSTKTWDTEDDIGVFLTVIDKV